MAIFSSNAWKSAGDTPLTRAYSSEIKAIAEGIVSPQARSIGSTTSPMIRERSSRGTALIFSPPTASTRLQRPLATASNARSRAVCPLEAVSTRSASAPRKPRRSATLVAMLPSPVKEEMFWTEMKTPSIRLGSTFERIFCAGSQRRSTSDRSVFLYALVRSTCWM